MSAIINTHINLDVLKMLSCTVVLLMLVIFETHVGILNFRKYKNIPFNTFCQCLISTPYFDKTLRKCFSDLPLYTKSN